MKTNLNIAMFTETFVPHKNGVTTSILHARRGLSGRGHRVTVYSAGPPVYENESVHYYGGKTFPLYPDFPIAIYPTRAARQNRRILAEQQPDLVHIHAPGPMGLRGYRAAKRHDLPFIVTYHTVTEPLVRYAPRGWKTIYRVGSTAVDRLLNSRSTLLIAPTEATKRDLLAKNPDWEAKIRVVPTGVDLDAFQPNLDASAIRASWGFGGGQRILLYLGRTSFEKRVDVVLEAFARLRARQHDLRLVIAGTGPAWNELQRQAARLRIADDVRFVGHVPDDQVPLYYNAADVFCSASEIETQGITLLEAMACGTPSAVAGAGGFLDLVQDGRNGYLFPQGSVDGAVHGIELALAAGSDLRRRARESARAYGLDHCITLLERAYHDALEADPDA